MEMLVILLLFIFCVFLMHGGVKSAKPSNGVMVSRSTPKVYPKDLVECGNCRGTGLDGFGIMPDSFECEGCKGRGYFKVDPNAKYMTWSELMKKYKE